MPSRCAICFWVLLLRSIRFCTGTALSLILDRGRLRLIALSLPAGPASHTARAPRPIGNTVGGRGGATGTPPPSVHVPGFYVALMYASEQGLPAQPVDGHFVPVGQHSSVGGADGPWSLQAVVTGRTMVKLRCRWDGRGYSTGYCYPDPAAANA